MGNSLSDQLLKAGLVSKGKAKKVRHEQKGKRKKGEGGGVEEEARSAAEQGAREKAERDRELNRQREAEKRERAVVAQIRQMIEANRRPKAEGHDGEAYNFTDGTKVKRIHVTKEVADAIARGQLAIVRLDEGYEVVPKGVAEKIRERDAAYVVVLNEGRADTPDEDDPYAEYQIPDDLMW
ncbi:DUF2058 domain-containing protein [Endothiovibrio diazotrophicus]